MSMMGGRIPAGREDVGQVVASFAQYEAAQKAVSTLISGEVPARDIAIVGQGLRSIERVTGKLGYATAARSGAINGLLLGLVFSAIFVLGSPSVPIQAFVGVLFVGIAIGMLLSIVTYSIVRRRRDFASVMQVVADRYEVTVSDSSIHRARQVLGTHLPTAPPAPAPATAPVPADDGPASADPPQYGERLPPTTPTPPTDEPVVSPGAPVAPEPPSSATPPLSPEPAGEPVPPRSVAPPASPEPSPIPEPEPAPPGAQPASFVAQPSRPE
ncbi:general stress protein [Microbacterium sp. P01]|uniref:general stress protein n=1 Tax=Microbacterium sp. P01 TaxID=3366261 RepID=UPI00366D56C2